MISGERKKKLILFIAEKAELRGRKREKIEADASLCVTRGVDPASEIEVDIGRGDVSEQSSSPTHGSDG